MIETIVGFGNDKQFDSGGGVNFLLVLKENVWCAVVENKVITSSGFFFFFLFGSNFIFNKCKKGTTTQLYAPFDSFRTSALDPFPTSPP